MLVNRALRRGEIRGDKSIGEDGRYFQRAGQKRYCETGEKENHRYTPRAEFFFHSKHTAGCRNNATSLRGAHCYVIIEPRVSSTGDRASIDSIIESFVAFSQRPRRITRGDLRSPKSLSSGKGISNYLYICG